MSGSDDLVDVDPDRCIHFRLVREAKEHDRVLHEQAGPQSLVRTEHRSEGFELDEVSQTGAENYYPRIYGGIPGLSDAGQHRLTEIEAAQRKKLRRRNASPVGYEVTHVPSLAAADADALRARLLL